MSDRCRVTPSMGVAGAIDYMLGASIFGKEGTKYE
jgi:hypothetical protein